MAQREVHLLISRLKKYDWNFIQVHGRSPRWRSQRSQWLPVTLCLKCKMDTAREEKGDPGHGHSLTPIRARQVVLSIYLGI